MPCFAALPQAIPLLKESIKKAYGKKGDKVVNMNWAGEALCGLGAVVGWRGVSQARC